MKRAVLMTLMALLLSATLAISDMFVQKGYTERRPVWPLEHGTFTPW